ncbi:hypothetical protein [Nocardiopsis sp. CNT312]|uniref:hypothetical protein n=1 Tax=Nocardiopsis sp. CNT312 TaxID=1137268 RepID=UPI0004B5AE72|nr:hypothetical protein [Nocardiopsis sp. CNT312]
MERSGQSGRVRLPVHGPSEAALSRLAGGLGGVCARRLRQEFPSRLRTYLGATASGPSCFAAS